MGVHNCGAAGGWAGNNSFSLVLSEAQTVATITVPAMFPSVPFLGFPMTMALLAPAVTLTIHLVLKKVVFLTFRSQSYSEKKALAFS